MSPHGWNGCGRPVRFYHAAAAGQLPDNCTAAAELADNRHMVSGWVYVLNNGGLRSLVATASVLAQSPRPRVALVHVHDGRATAAIRLEHVHRQAEHFSVRQVVDLPLPQAVTVMAWGAATDAEEFAAAPLLRIRVLMSALAYALQTQAERLIWPAQFNADFHRMTAVSEQLVLMRHLAELEPEVLPAGAGRLPGPVTLPTIETPLIDLTDKQLVELGGQLQAPWHLAWSCQLHNDRPCRVCPSCRRRHAAFDTAGIVDPIDQLAMAQ